jgi:DNA repair/transcription protein MET18/MMS19
MCGCARVCRCERKRKISLWATTTGITKEKLVEGLRACLHASPLFVPFCMDLLMDKITSTINDTKIECFLTLRDAAPSFGYLGILPYLE